MFITKELYDEELDDWVEIQLPAHYEVCYRCRGEGQHTNPNIDGNGLPQEYVEDPEFMEEYLAGAYDVSCEVCNGNRVVPVIDRSRCDPKILKQLDQEQQELAEMRAIERQERMMGA